MFAIHLTNSGTIVNLTIFTMITYNLSNILNQVRANAVYINPNLK